MTEQKSREFGMSEVDDSLEARTEDVKKFWVGFEEWREKNKDLETVLIKDIDERAKSRWGRPAFESETGRAAEAFMVIIYGATLTKELKPQLSESVPLPQTEISAAVEAADLMPEISNTGKLEEATLRANLSFLINVNNFGSEVTNRYYEPETKSVSKYLYDDAIVHLASIGAEEFAHNLLVHYKQGDKLINLMARYFLQSAESKVVEARAGEKAGRVHYHAIEVERRAMTWKLAFLEKYLPHWSSAFREFKKEVSQKRLEDVRK